MTERALNCQELVELITSYLDDALPGDERARFERHLSVCAGCRAYLAQMRTMLRLLGTLAANDIPAPMQRDLLAAFRGLRKNTDVG